MICDPIWMANPLIRYGFQELKARPISKLRAGQGNRHQPRMAEPRRKNQAPPEGSSTSPLLAGHQSHSWAAEPALAMATSSIRSWVCQKKRSNLRSNTVIWLTSKPHQNLWLLFSPDRHTHIIHWRSSNSPFGVPGPRLPEIHIFFIFRSPGACSLVNHHIPNIFPTSHGF